MSRFFIFFPIALSFFLYCGCDVGTTRTNQSRQVESEDWDDDEDDTAEPEAVLPEPRTEIVKAEMGVTGKADFAKNGVSDIMSPITVPVGEYFKARERVVFDMEIPKSMQIFKAMNNNKGPATEEEFMERIIEENGIRLPQLPPEHSYIYDPATETLNVIRPAR